MVDQMRGTSDIDNCPFCGSDDCDLFEDGETDICILCGDCQAQGPATRVGCREEDECDLVEEAIALWNGRAKEKAE